jgi:hypothetical protein
MPEYLNPDPLDFTCLPTDEIDAHRHPILPNSERFEILRFVYDFDREAGENTITLTLVSRDTADRKTLRFSGVRSTHPLADYFGIYVVDTSYRQWDRDARIEVGEYFEDRGVYFYAKSVEEVPTPTQ